MAMLPFNFKNRLSSQIKYLAITADGLKEIKGIKEETASFEEPLIDEVVIKPISSIYLSADLFDSVMDEGFYPLENIHEKFFRWTRGHASLDVHIPKNFSPNRIVINFIYTHPKGSKLKIVYNKHLLISAHIAPGASQHEFKIPASARSTNAHIEIYSDTFLPLPLNQGGRVLGVAISSIQLYRTKMSKFLSYVSIGTNKANKKIKKNNHLTSSLLHLQKIALTCFLPTLNNIEMLGRITFRKLSTVADEANVLTTQVSKVAQQLDVLENKNHDLQKKLSSMEEVVARLYKITLDNFENQFPILKNTTEQVIVLQEKIKDFNKQLSLVNNCLDIVKAQQITTDAKLHAIDKNLFSMASQTSVIASRTVAIENISETQERHEQTLLLATKELNKIENNIVGLKDQTSNANSSLEAVLANQELQSQTIGAAAEKLNNIVALNAKTSEVVPLLEALQTKQELHNRSIKIVTDELIKVENKIIELKDKTNEVAPLLEAMHAHQELQNGSLRVVGAELNKIESNIVELKNQSDKLVPLLEMTHTRQELHTQSFIAASNELIKIESTIGELASKNIAPIFYSENHLIIKIFGHALAIPIEDQQLAMYLAFYGDVERGMRIKFSELIQDGMYVVDVGAHIGIYTLLAAARVGRKGKVFSYEPTARTFQFLEKNIYLNNYADIVEHKFMAVGEKQEKCSFGLFPVSGHNSLFFGQETTDLIEVDVVRLDDQLEGVQKIDIVKIDAEGADLFVLKGMSGIIEKNPQIKIFFEFAPSILRRSQLDPAFVLEELRKFNFSIYQIDDYSGELHLVDETHLLTVCSANLLLLKE